jgi:hypothetical protein
MLLQQLQGSKDVTHPGWLGSTVRLTPGECRLNANARGSARQFVVCGKGVLRRELMAVVAQGEEGRLMGREPPASTKLDCGCRKLRSKQQVLVVLAYNSLEG